MIDIKIFNDTTRKRLPKMAVVEILNYALKQQKIRKAVINLIYVDNAQILELNKKFLKHNHFTDVISFNLEESDFLLGEIYISVDTAIEQSIAYGVSLTNEILRLSVHGLLHLCGMKDELPQDKMKMTQIENKYLKAFYVRENN